MTAGDLPMQAEDHSGLVLERDLILSDMRSELFALLLRQDPLVALRWLSGRVRGDEPLPFNPEALRYNQTVIAGIRRRADGQMPEIKSSLPLGWQKAILDHIGFAAEKVTIEQAAAVPSSRVVHGPLAYLKALRLHQWTKNILVFVPLLMSHQFLVAQPLINSLLAFVCFGLVASAIYLVNDIMDLHQDRKHPTKRNRPFASGAIPVSHGLILSPALIATALLIASYLPRTFLLVMAVYFALNLSYTFYLKRKLLVDVLALSGAYTLRILAGNAAGPIELSNWLLAFSLFLFFSLALVKRYVELDTVEGEQTDAKRFMGRGYRRDDLDMISQLGVASGFAAVIVLALFVDGAGKSGLYKNREMIWLIVPIVLYVIGRIWVLAKRREIPDDPIYFIITDWRSHLMAAIAAVVFFMAV
jgi:4-hydroxybenzoate polyprenyltransferase